MKHCSMETTLSHRLHVICTRLHYTAQTRNIYLFHKPLRYNPCVVMCSSNEISSIIWIQCWWIDLFYFLIKCMSCSFPQHSLAEYKHADPVDMIDLLATMPRGYCSLSLAHTHSHTQWVLHHTSLLFLFGFQGTLGWLMDQWRGLIW